MRLAAVMSNRRGQGTVENLMLTVILAAVLVPIVYKSVISPLLGLFQEQRTGLVKFIAQNNKKPVPNVWFASERAAQMKDPQNIDETKEIKSTEIPEPGEVTPPKDVNAPKDINTKPINSPKEIKEPQKINPPSSGGSGGAGGAGGAGSAMGSGAQDPDFFSGGNKGPGGEKGGESGSSGSGGGSGSVNGGDEYSPKGKSAQGTYTGDDTNKRDGAKKDEMGPDRKEKQNLSLTETREEERTRSTPFDWWLLIKILIVGLIIFLILLIGLSNMKKR